VSLTSFLETSPDVRAYLRDHFPKPEPVRRPMLRVARRSAQPSWIGTAFDYLLRWAIMARFSITCEPGPWIAELALTRMRPGSAPQKLALRSIIAARRRAKLYVSTGQLNSGLLKSAIELARIDPIFRAGVGHEYLGLPIEPSYVSELKQMLCLVPFEKFHPRRRCLLNPAFTSSHLVGGADCDLLIDDALIDVKTTSDGKCYREYLNQLLGYYLLYRHMGIHELPRRPRIRRLGIYFARHGVLYYWDVEQLASEKVISNATRWFMNAAANRYGRRAVNLRVPSSYPA
jgi:hypothetical protein